MISTFFKGMVMGIADLIPGVSGGTLALIIGIYTRLILAVSSLAKLLQARTWFSIFSSESKRTLSKFDLSFLIPLALGVMTSILLFSRLILYLLENHAIPIWSFFLSLIVFSAIALFRPLASSLVCVLLLSVGVLVALGINSLGTTDTTGGSLKIFVSGVLAISAMVLPGISGSLVLVMLGEYQTMLAALHDFNFQLIFLFIFGCAVGILVTTQFLRWLVSYYKNETLAFFCGFMLGTAPRLWPWQMKHDLVDQSAIMFQARDMALLSPFSFQAYSNQQPELVQALLAVLFAAILSFLLHRKGNKIYDSSD